VPYGRWAGRLAEELLGVWAQLDGEQELGEPGEIVWYPDRGWHGWRYVPGTCMTAGGYELFGYVRFQPDRDGGEPVGFSAWGDFTEQTAARNPNWRLDVCEEAIGDWHGKGEAARMTLVWGRPLLAGGWIVTGELGGVTVDQCELVDGRFTLIAPDDYQHDLLEVALWDARGRELARESLYEDEDEEEEEEEEQQQQ
jgi:hypothetical protein